MKRKVVLSYDVFRTYPLFFWRKCEKCGNEFRKEWGWRALTGPYHGVHGVLRYLCKTCAPSQLDASEFFLRKRYVPFISQKPPAPPAPPPLRKFKESKDKPETD